jgi:hypothetical protein
MSEVKPPLPDADATVPVAPPSKPIKVKFYIGDEEVGMLLLAPKEFSTGSTGYFTNGKVSLGDDAEKGYQVQVQMVRIGSKAQKKV